MPVKFVPLDKSLLSLTQAFNDRMIAGNAPVDFYLPTGMGRPLNPAAQIQEQHVIAVDDGLARGGFIEAVYAGWLDNSQTPLTNVSAILSEGVIDKKYLMLPAQMTKAFLRRNPHTFVVGMGGERQPLPRVLKAAGWSVEKIPFFFRICRASRALRQLEPLQRPAWKRFAAQAAAATGTGALAIHAGQAFRGAAWRGDANAEIKRFTDWDSWADAIWDSAKEPIRMCVAHTAASLKELYAPGDPRMRCYRIDIDGKAAAWVTALISPYKNHKYFGDLTVAVILDALAIPGAHRTALSLATSALAAEKADLVAANFSHSSWCDAFRAAGFWAGPSNYLLACAPALSKVCNSAPVASGVAHFTRGDGDGRVNL
jgi:hypothetical protein